MEPFYQEQVATIYKGHALEVLKALPDESVQMCMTSPPYWGLRNYAGGEDIVWGGDSCQHKWNAVLKHRSAGGPQVPQSKWPSNVSVAEAQRDTRSNFCSLCGAWRGQLGLEPTPELYVSHLMMIFSEVKRVLRRDGSFYLNIGDTYTSGKGSCYNPGGGNASWRSWNDRRANYPTGRDAPNRMYQGLPPKCMTLIPERVMFALVDDGWILQNKIIWKKPNSMPGSQKGRFTTTWEYVYFFVKNNKTCLWRNRETGEWRDTKLSREELYPWGGMYQNITTGEIMWKKPESKDGWVKLLPLWMGFAAYFELDEVRVPHKTQSLERYASAMKRGDGGSGKLEEGIGAIQHRMGMDRICAVPKDVADLFGHGPQPQSFNLRVRDVKRGKKGTSALTGELRASDQEVEEYDYPEKHHGSSMNNQEGLHIDRARHGFGQKAHGGMKTNITRPEDGPEPNAFHPKGKNPGDVVEIHRQKPDGRFERDHLSRPPEPEVDPARAFSAKGKNPGDTFKYSDASRRETKQGFENLNAKGHSGYYDKDGNPLVDFAKGKNPGDYWEITTKPSSICVCPQCESVFSRYTKVCPKCKVKGVIGHFAPFPVDLCINPIKASSRVGDIILDPFAGGGNTGVAAKMLGRKCILIDVVKEYCIMAKYKLSKVEYQPELVGYS